MFFFVSAHTLHSTMTFTQAVAVTAYLCFAVADVWFRNNKIKTENIVTKKKNKERQDSQHLLLNWGNKVREIPLNSSEDSCQAILRASNQVQHSHWTKWQHIGAKVWEVVHQCINPSDYLTCWGADDSDHSSFFNKLKFLSRDFELTTSLWVSTCWCRDVE